VLVGDILFECDVVAGAAVLVDDAGDGGLFPEELAVFAAVLEGAAPFAAVGDGFPQGGVNFGWGVSGFEDAWVEANDLGGGVAGDAAEAGVDVFDAAGGVGDDDAGGDLLDGAGE